MGDPETEVVIPRIKSDLLNLFKGISNGTFGEQDFYVDEDVATTVMLVSVVIRRVMKRVKVLAA